MPEILVGGLYKNRYIVYHFAKVIFKWHRSFFLPDIKFGIFQVGPNETYKFSQIEACHFHLFLLFISGILFIYYRYYHHFPSSRFSLKSVVSHCFQMSLYTCMSLHLYKSSVTGSIYCSSYFRMSIFMMLASEHSVNT